MPTFLSPLNLTQQEIQNAVAQNLAAAPGSPKKGQFYMDTVSNTLFWYSGTSWVAAQGSAPSFASPGSSAVGDSIGAGVSTSGARADHVHGREGFGNVTAATTFGISSANGTAVTEARSDHTHGTPATPTPAAVGAISSGAGTVPLIGAGATGARPAAGNLGNLYLDTTTFLLYRDNATTWDQVDGFGTPGSSAVGDVAAAGAATTFARSNHVHGREAFGTPGSSAVGDSAAAGSAVTVAHSDHVHGREAFGNVVSSTAFGASAANGTAVTEARADHVHGTPTHVDADHSGIHLNALAQPTAAVNMGGQKITNGADPTSSTDFATKQYVDAAAVGIDFKPSVKAATTAALATNTYANGASGVGATLTCNTNVVLAAQDGYTPLLGDRLLVKNEATAANNGIYTVTAVGSGAAPWVLTRATDSDSAAELNAGALVYVEQGTVAGTEQWVMTTTGAIVVGTTGITWTQFSGASTLSAGAGLTATGNVFAVGAGAGITVAADSVAIDTSVVARKFAVLVGDGASTSIVVTHNLGTVDVVVSLAAAATPFAEVIADVQHTSTNTITLIFAVAPASNAYRCAVLG